MSKKRDKPFKVGDPVIAVGDNNISHRPKGVGKVVEVDDETITDWKVKAAFPDYPATWFAHRNLEHA